MTYRNKSKAGFTLLEVMLAMAIFSMLSLLTFEMLSAAISSNERTKTMTQRFARLQRTVNFMGKDLQQLVPDRISAKEMPLTFIRGGMKFTTENWHINTTSNKGSDLQFVSWTFRDNALYRGLSTSPKDNPPIDTPPLLTQVKSFSLRYYQDGWRAVDNKSPLATLPKALEVTLNLTDLGEIKRIYLLSDDAPQSSDFIVQPEAKNSEATEKSGTTPAANPVNNPTKSPHSGNYRNKGQ